MKGSRRSREGGEGGGGKGVVVRLLEKLEASNPEEAAKLREELEKKLSKVGK